ncbi:MAG: homoserine dehydrogenase, partial [Clostridia bacterium]|nr:homoserine dehydrogenase [Clostridia bacterium]
MINVAIMGHGVVGSGVAEILIHHQDRMEKRAGQPVHVKYILDLRDFDSLSYRDRFIKDFDRILQDEEIGIVAEMMGGLHPAYEFVKSCLSAGKSVVTSNKELVAAKGSELLRVAAEHQANFLFEASVGGGIPVLRPMAQCLAANEITEISGILNGTTNYILNKMLVDNMDFSDALRLAQEKGYAEKDPTADIEGHDACRKICILAALGFGRHIYPEQVLTSGITAVTREDMERVDAFGCVIKLIGHAKRLPGGKITATVRPTLVSRDHILASVNGVFNAVMVTGDQTGEVLFYGKGAGKEATASAVVADILDCIRHPLTGQYWQWAEGSDDLVDNSGDDPQRFYVCLHTADTDALIRQVEDLFPGSCRTKDTERGAVALITRAETESEIRRKTALLQGVTDIKILH